MIILQNDLLLVRAAASVYNTLLSCIAFSEKQKRKLACALNICTNGTLQAKVKDWTLTYKRRVAAVI